MKIAILLFLIGIISFQVNAESPPTSEPVFSRFVGVLHHDKARVDQLAKIDFVLDRDLGNILELSAILTLHFGDFESKEYVSYYFENVRFNVVTGTLLFDQADQIVTVLVKGFSKDRFEGEVRIALGDEKLGTLELTKEEAHPTAPLIGSVGGQYESSNGYVLQLQTFRSTNDLGNVGNPFAANGIKGRMAKYNQVMGGTAVTDVFTAGSYDFFNQKLVLWGDPETMACDVTPSELRCDKGIFRKVTSSSLPMLFPPTAKQRPLPGLESIPVGSVEPPTAIGGEYMGYLHHDYLDQYQVVSLNIIAVQSGPSEGGALRLSTTAKVYFGDQKSHEAIFYKFDPRAFPLNSKLFVFRRPDIDPIVQITSASQGVLQGVWYSQMFGKVGRFALFKKGLPTLSQGSFPMYPVSRSSRIGYWQLRETVGLGVTSSSTSNPFFPLTFGGYLWDVRGYLIPKSAINGGSYDFYTGRIAFSLFVEGENVYMVGIRHRSGALDLLFYLSNKWGVLLKPLRVMF